MEGISNQHPGLDDVVAGNHIHRYEIIEPCPYAEGVFKKGFLVKPRNTIGAPSLDSDKTYVMKIFKQRSDIVAISAVQNLDYVKHDVKTIFENEIQKLDRIEGHPNIARIVDAGMYQVGSPQDGSGLLYFVEEYVEGMTLSQVLDAVRIVSDVSDELKQNGVIDEAGFIDYNFTVNIAYQLAKGIKHLHDAKMAHSDVKPSNILISDDYSRAVLTDFGSATVKSDIAYFQVGSVLYRAPETARAISKAKDGLPKVTDSRHGDKWALGIVLYEMLTGKYPFETDTPDWSGLHGEYLRNVQKDLENVMRQGLKKENLPSEINARVSPKMNELVMSLLQKSPQARIGIDKVVQKLGAFVSNVNRKV